MTKKDNCRIINGIRLCNPSAMFVKFNFLTDGAQNNQQQHNAIEYLQKMRDRAEEVERSVEGQRIYNIFVDLAEKTNLGKTKGRQELVDTIKMGTDVCKTLKCNTTTEMSLILTDVMNIFKDKKIKLPDKAHELVLSKKLGRFIERVAEGATVKKSVLA